MRAIWVCVIVAACSKGGGGGASSPDGVGDGKERGACYGNGTCDQGLVCYSDLCVRPPGADCDKVAEKLSGYRLDNYAPRDERAKVIAEIAAMCTKELISEEEGRCILEAHGRAEIGACPRPLLPELVSDPSGCKGFGSHFTDVFFADLIAKGGDRRAIGPFRDQLERELDASCAEDGWAEAARSCVRTATSMDRMNDCDDLVTDELQDKVRKRLDSLMDQIQNAADSGKRADSPAVAPATSPP